MAKIGRKLSELELLEGGGGSGMMGGGGGRNPFTRPPAVTKEAFEKEFNKPPKREYTLSPLEREAMIHDRTSKDMRDTIRNRKPEKDRDQAMLDYLGVGLGGASAALTAGMAMTPKPTPEERSNRKEKADRKNIPSFAETPSGYKKGGYVKSADGIAQRGKTRGRMC